MAPSSARLSAPLIVATAIELLDDGGESALTFRALAARLSTGPGALYGHVADKDALLAAAADEVVTAALAERPAAGAHAAIRAAALALFDAIDAHPWVGAQLQREPSGAAMTRVWERLGGPLAGSVPGPALFDCASAVVSYVLGVAGQNAANARLAHGNDRTTVLTAAADRWRAHDPTEHPFLHRIAAELASHDDRAQFLAGIDLILAGIDALGQADPVARADRSR